MKVKTAFILGALFLYCTGVFCVAASQKKSNKLPPSQAGKTNAHASETEGCCDAKDLKFLALAKNDMNERLRQASLIACVEEINALLDKGADVNAKNQRGDTALTLASIQGAVSEVHYQRETSPQGVKCRVETLRILIEHGATSDSINTALVNSVEWGRVAVVEFLLSRNMPLEAKNEALIAAVSAAYNAEKVLTMMLDSGAKVDAKDDQGNTAFMNAARSGKTRLAQLLLAKGADINAKNNEGSTPLIEAVIHMRGGGVTVEFIKFLLANKAEVNGKNIKGETALLWAERYQDSALSRLLKQAGAKA